MGMFDTIRFDCPLPIVEELADRDLSRIEFQTKDFDNLLDNYNVDLFGNIYRRSLKENSIKLNITSTLRFYTSVDLVVNYEVKVEREKYFIHESLWVEFQAKFVHGKCRSVELLNKDLYKKVRRLNISYYNTN